MSQIKSDSTIGSGTMKVAVIGGGLTGLSCGWLLSKNPDVKVTLFEKMSTIGMDAGSVDLYVNKMEVLNESGMQAKNSRFDTKIRMDVPLRVFSISYYPNLTKLYEAADIKIVPEDYAASFCDVQGNTYFKYCNLLIKELSLSFIWPGKNLFQWPFLNITYHIARFFYLTPKDIKRHYEDGHLENITIHEYLVKRGYSDNFIHKFFYPSCASMCTCSWDAIQNYPALILLEYLVRRSGYGVRRVDDGVQSVITKLSKNFHQVRCDSDITGIYPSEGKVIVESQYGKEVYDHVVLATEATSALKLLKNPTKELHQALSSFDYQKSSVVVHTDSKLMPANRADWSSVNLFVSDKFDKPMATIWMNRVQNSLKDQPVDVFQTWNPIMDVSEKNKLSETEFVRPLMTLKAVKGIELLQQIQGNQNIWVCGSYSLYGMPLLENACCSGLKVAETISGLKRPWKYDPFSKAHLRTSWTSTLIWAFVFLVVFLIFVL
eukprot:TRINITY_DN3452_c0_g1_i2.p1 TRINITY_DN3452_c0_g1~~TRINITY_DN3452_c0_g1_i2.p1  ORF type:complete len:490 (+),score=98.30 TRINITY_DN3452_c0_g1_i2:122-1591(+)